MRFLLCACLAISVLGVESARAQDEPAISIGGNPIPATKPATLDLVDVWRKLRGQERPPGEVSPANKRYVVFAPIIGSKPSTGISGGLSWSAAFFSGGDTDDTHISSLSGGFRFSQKKQTMLTNRIAMFTAEDRWYLQGDNRLFWTSQDTYTLGASSPAASSENLKFDFVRLYETAYRRVMSGLFLGAGINYNTHANVVANSGDQSAFDQSAYVAYSQQHGLSTERQTSSGTMVGLRYDTRDNAINAERGWLASGTYRTFFSALGGDSTWQQLSLDVRTYKSLTKDARQRLAFWFLGDLVTGGTVPYLDLPSTGSDGRSARGYADGRYRGEHLLYGEAEFRGTITRNGLLGVVAFANITTVGSAESRDALFGSYAPAAGGGLRVMLNKRSRTNLCADYGWGKEGSRGFYLYIQEAF